MLQNKLFKILFLYTTILFPCGQIALGQVPNSNPNSNPVANQAQETNAKVEKEKAEPTADQKSDKKFTPRADAPSPGSMKLNPALAPYLTKAYAQLSKGNNQAAVSLLNQALKIDAGSIHAKRYLAFARMRSGQAKEALKIMQDLSKHTALDNFDWYIFAESYHEQGADAIAAACYEQSLKILPGYDAARAGLVKALTALGQYDRARQEIATGFNLSKDQQIRQFYDQMKETVSYVERVDTEQRFGEQTGLSNEQMSRVGDKPVVINPGMSTDGY